MRDFIQDIDGDLNLDNGDIIMGEATLQHQRDCILTRAGSMKHAPARGVGVEDYFNDENQEDLLRKIRQELTKDGMKINQLGTNSKPATPSVTRSFTDWFMPEIDLVEQMDINLHAFGFGNFENTYYWSSTEGSAEEAWSRDFNLNASVLRNKEDGCNIRPCRSFEALEGAYHLRDTGPAGGLIFYISGTTYKEAAPFDLSRTIETGIGAMEISTNFIIS